MIFSPEAIFCPGKEFRWGGSFSGRKLSDGIFPQGDSFPFPGEVVSPCGDSFLLPQGGSFSWAMWLPRGCSSLGWRFSPRWGDVSVGEELCSPRMERSLGEGGFPAGRDFGQGGGFPGVGFGS